MIIKWERAGNIKRRRKTVSQNMGAIEGGEVATGQRPELGG